MKTPRTALVTGAGSGLGRDIALGLAARGYQVFGTAYDETEVTELAQASSNVNLTVTDIRDLQEIKALADKVTAATGGRLDLLVSNAGILTPGPLEVLDLDEIRNEFEVNVFGILAVVNAFLPALRTSTGRIVQISTASVDFPLPFNGPSAASKTAAETFMTAYRAELAAFGIKVQVAVPGNVRTGGPAKTAQAIQEIAENMTATQKDLYGETFNNFALRLNAFQSSGMSSADATAEIISLAEQDLAEPRAGIGDEARELLQTLTALSQADLDEQLVAFLAPLSE